MLLQLYFILSIIAIANIIETYTKESDMQAIKANFSCNCGKVKGVVDSESALRFVCYSKDCRGYYNTLNELAKKMGLSEQPLPAKLDPWGGTGELCCSVLLLPK